MDNLAKDAAKALAAGMSYGRWKAMQEPVKIPERKKMDVHPDHGICEYCGEEFYQTDTMYKRKFCSETCRRAGTARSRRRNALSKV